MSGDNINFDDKKIKKSEFYKNKKVNSIDDIDVYKMFKKNHMAKRIQKFKNEILHWIQ